jgi:1-acyl-sn-glycerol-3-phosphate acyltransferase
MSFYNNVRVVFSPILRLIFGIKRVGKANLPLNGAVIICSNHRSNYDPVLLGASLGRDLKFMAKAELFKNPFLRVLITSLGAFPVRRGQGDSEAINKAVSILNNGNALIMFPEGHRQKSGGTPLRFQSGAARFAYTTHATVLPVAIVTKGDVKPFKRNIIRVGKPLSYNDLGFTDGNRENLHEVSNMLRDKVDELIHA